MDRALIIRQPHIGKILDGIKTWEMRSRNTNVRGRIGLIEQGTGLIVGEAEIIASKFKTDSMLASERLQRHHHADPELLKEKGHNWAWLLTNVKRYKTPKPYDHPKGAVIWVRL